MVMLSSKKAGKKEARHQPSCWWGMELGRKMPSLGSQKVWPQLRSHSCVTLGKSLPLSGPTRPLGTFFSVLGQGP